MGFGHDTPQLVPDLVAIENLHGDDSIVYDVENEITVLRIQGYISMTWPPGQLSRPRHSVEHGAEVVCAATAIDDPE